EVGRLRVDKNAGDIVFVHDFFPVYFHDNIARLQAGVIGGAPTLDVADNGAFRPFETKIPCHAAIDSLELPPNPEISIDLPGLLQLGEDSFDAIDRDCEPEPDASGIRGKDNGIDADNFSGGIQQWAA